MRIEMNLSSLKVYMASEIGLEENRLQWIRDGQPCVPTDLTLVIDVSNEIAHEVIERWSKKKASP